MRRKKEPAREPVAIRTYSDDDLDAMNNTELIRIQQACHHGTRELETLAGRVKRILNIRIREELP